MTVKKVVKGDGNGFDHCPFCAGDVVLASVVIGNNTGVAGRCLTCGAIGPQYIGQTKKSIAMAKVSYNERREYHE